MRMGTFHAHSCFIFHHIRSELFSVGGRTVEADRVTLHELPAIPTGDDEPVNQAQGAICAGLQLRVDVTFPTINSPILIEGCVQGDKQEEALKLFARVHVDAIMKMMNNKRYCIDISTQLLAVILILKKKIQMY